jgi:lysophospholipase L1-like esterase
MRIAILADSNALPRPTEWGGLLLEHTYPYLLERALRARFPLRDVHVIERGKRYRTILGVLEDWYEIVSLRKPDVIVVQVGGADCAPRVLLPKERAFFKNLPFGKWILKLEEKYRRGWLLRFSPRVCVSVSDFREAVVKVIEKARAANAKLVFVNVFEPAPEVLDQFAGAQALIDRYNAVLADEASRARITLIDLNTMVRNIGGAGKHTVDGLHLDSFAQRLLTDHLKNAIVKLFDQPSMSYAVPSPRAVDISQ